MIDKALFSSASIEWETPQAFFDILNSEFGFTLDVCASEENAKCPRYNSREEPDKFKWTGEVCWMNPPYGRAITEIWAQRAHNSAVMGTVVVGLLPARTDTIWFHKFIYQLPSVEVRFIKGRLKFGGSKNSAPFPSMVVVWR